MRKVRDITLDALDECRFSLVITLYLNLLEARRENAELRKKNERLIAKAREYHGLPPKKRS